MKLTQTTIEETDQPAYDVHLELSRTLTPGEHDAVNAWPSQGIKSPAGWVHLRSPAKHLTVGQTTIEKVAEHVDFFKDLVAKIAAEGEEYQKRADEAQRQADEQERALQTERARRRDLAAKIKFD